MTEIRDTLAMIFAWPFWGLFAWMLPKLWHNVRGLHTDTPPPGTRARPWWHAFVRVQAAGLIAFLVIIPPAFVSEFVADDSTVGVICQGLLLIGGFVGFVLVPVVWFYNRPSFLVAPHHRNLPGLLAERRGAPVPPVPPPAKPPKWHARSTA
jgi:hypothetical protein